MQLSEIHGVRRVNMKLKGFFIIFKGFSLKQIKITFFDGKNPPLKEFSNYR